MSYHFLYEPRVAIPQSYVLATALYSEGKNAIDQVYLCLLYFFRFEWKLLDGDFDLKECYLGFFVVFLHLEQYLGVLLVQNLWVPENYQIIQLLPPNWSLRWFVHFSTIIIQLGFIFSIYIFGCNNKPTSGNLHLILPIRAQYIFFFQVLF